MDQSHIQSLVHASNQAQNPQSMCQIITQIVNYVKTHVLDQVERESACSFIASRLAGDVKFPVIQAKCIVSLCAICNSSRDSKQWNRCSDICIDFAVDIDARNRCAAMQGIELLLVRVGNGNRNAHLDSVKMKAIVNKMYSVAVSNLKDKMEDVRLAAIRPVWLCSRELISMSETKEEKNKFIDNAFVELVECIDDMFAPVRSEAVSLIAGLSGNGASISTDLLKKALSNRVIMSSNLDAASTIKGAKPWRWARLQRLMEAETKLKPKDDKYASSSVQLHKSVLEGALIDALEDDHVTVRNSAINSLTELSVSHPICAPDAVDYIVDMLHDEMETARISAAKSLVRLGGVVSLEKDQLGAILSHLNDTDSDLRHLLHKVLHSIELPDSDSVFNTVNAVLSTLSRFPMELKAEIQSVYSCLAGIGRRNAGLLQSLVDPLLHIDHRFASREPNTGDSVYSGLLVLFANAARVHSSILALLPAFCFAHFEALYDKYPQYLPPVSERPVHVARLGLVFQRAQSLDEDEKTKMEIDEDEDEEMSFQRLISYIDQEFVKLSSSQSLPSICIVGVDDVLKFAQNGVSVGGLALFCYTVIEAYTNLLKMDYESAIQALNEAVCCYGGLSMKCIDTLLGLISRAKSSEVEVKIDFPLPTLRSLILIGSDYSSIVRYYARCHIENHNSNQNPNSRQHPLKYHAGWPLTLNITGYVDSLSQIDDIRCILSTPGVYIVEKPVQCCLVQGDKGGCSWKVKFNVKNVFGVRSDPFPVRISIGLYNHFLNEVVHLSSHSDGDGDGDAIVYLVSL